MQTATEKLIQLGSIPALRGFIIGFLGSILGAVITRKFILCKKKLVSIRLSAEVLEYFKATGDGWQTRIDETLKSKIAKAR
jgi:hypothetical protein